MKLLLVDDDPIAISALVDLLTDAGHDVSVANDGERGLAQILATPPDVVVTDMQMPKLSGLDMIRAARAGGARSFFILCTALVPPDAAGAADLILLKPLKLSLLFAALRKASHPPSQSQGLA